MLNIWPFNKLQALREENINLRRLLAGDMTLLHDIAEGDDRVLTFRSKAFTVIANAFIQVYRNSAGTNYLSMTFSDYTTGEDFELLVQRKAGETPAQKATRLEAELEYLKNTLPYRARHGQ